MGVEAGRGIAAILVVLLHSGSILSNPKSFGRTPFGPLFSFGHAGVDFFFVLSGFVILFAHFKDLNRIGRLGTYFIRRLTRIYPPYWAASTIMLAIFFISPSHTGRETTLPVIIRSYLLFPQPGGPLLSVAWSLQNEIIFYLMFAFLIVNLRFGLAVFALWFVSVAGFTITGAATFPWDALFTVFNLDFFMGMFAAYVLTHRTAIRWRPLLTAGGLTFGLTAIAEILGRIDGHATPARLLYGVGSMLLIIGVAEGERSGAFQVSKLMAVLGSASYSIYLVHVPVLLVADQALRITHLNQFLPAEIAFLLCAGTAVVAAVMFSRWIEFPLLNATRSAVKSLRGAPTASVVAVAATKQA